MTTEKDQEYNEGGKRQGFVCRFRDFVSSIKEKWYWDLAWIEENEKKIIF